jgi:twitching motility protein PilT
MASLINVMNEERSDHILSIEDPIEYLHVSKRCVVNQREVNRHTRSFANALKSALREDPDVICIGELRDLETISLALSAAETGHLVLGTLHTQGAVRTINRVIGAYPASQQAQVRTMLSESLRAIISQKLIPRSDKKGMALAYELLLVNVATSNLIRENRTFQLGSVLQTGRSKGMRSMDDSLTELVQKNMISKKEAALHAEDARLFKEK